MYIFFFSSRRRHTRCSRDWSSDVCSSDLDSIGPKLGRGTSSSVRATCTVPIWVPPASRVRLNSMTQVAEHFPLETGEEEIEMIVPVWAIVLATAKQRAWVKGWKKR